MMCLKTARVWRALLAGVVVAGGGMLPCRRSRPLLPRTSSSRLFFMHFWANDDAQKLAKGLRAVLDNVVVKKS
jgi:hypothetical protein